jgi:hypothetical protein
MKERNINIKVDNITPKQWANLIIELNLVASTWRPFGPRLKIKAHHLDKIIKSGRKKHDDHKND